MPTLTRSRPLPYYARRFAGLIVTLLTIAILELLRAANLVVPNPPALLLVGVVLSSFTGGTVHGVISAFIAWTYFAYHFSSPERILRFDDANLVRIIVWAFATPIIAVLVGILHHRAVAAAKREELARSAAAIERGVQNTQLIIEHALDAVVCMDEHGVITEWNPQAQAIFGWSRSEALGRTMADTIIPERYRDAHQHGLQRFLTTGKASILGKRFEIEAVGRSGNEFPVEIAVCLLHSNGGRTFSAFIRDISDRRAAQRKQELMLRELDHRVKNNLASVISILEQTAFQSASLESFVTTFRGRIMAMARLHNSLAATRWTGADLATLIRQTLEPYAMNTEGRVVIRGPAIMLPSTAVSSVCMTVHELATNASKYGALSVPEGRVLVEWTRETRDDGADVVRFIWTEQGGPPVIAPTRQGFGRRLIEEGIPYEVDGRATLDFSPAGVTCELVVPLNPAPAL